MRRRILWGVALGFCLSAAVHSVPLWAQWSGEVGGGYVWQSVAGNEDAFVTQYGQNQGFVLEDFSLAYTPKGGERETFALEGWGFGGAEPAEHASLLFRAGHDWTFNLAYDRQNYFYGIAAGDLANRRSRWDIERWRGSVVWDGWSAARLTLDLRYYTKGGYVYRGMVGQNYVVYPTRNNYSQDMKEASFKIETKTLPVYLSFEQAYTRYEREDRWEPAGTAPIYGTSNSVLTALSTPRRDRSNVPSSRLIAAYRNDWVDVSGSFFYSKADMDSTGTRQTVYDVGSGNIGQFIWTEDTAGSAKQDTRAADVDAAFRLGAGWSLRLSGDYRDSTQDSNLLGNHILGLGKPGGYHQQIVTPVGERGFFDVKDTVGRFEINKEGQGWAVWAGYQSGSRDVSWRRENDDPGEDVNRTGDGWFAGAAWSKTPALRIQTEYEHGTFENFVFRTDSDLVERFTFKLSSGLGKGWTIGARARWEWGENPAGIADARRQYEAYGASLAWANPKGTAGFGVTADLLSMDTRTDIFLPPAGLPGYSRYNLDALELCANGFFNIGKLHLDADLTQVRDSGDSWPMESWSAGLRAAIDGPSGLQFVFFGQYRSYVEDYTSVDDFYARRFGVILRWRF